MPCSRSQAMILSGTNATLRTGDQGATYRISTSKNDSSLRSSDMPRRVPNDFGSVPLQLSKMIHHPLPRRPHERVVHQHPIKLVRLRFPSELSVRAAFAIVGFDVDLREDGEGLESTKAFLERGQRCDRSS